MKKGGTIPPEQIRQAQRLFNDLPVKNDKKTRKEAAEILEKDFRKAFKKGYTPKELSMLLKNRGIIIPAYLTKKFLAPEKERLQSPKSSPEGNTKKTPPTKLLSSFSVPLRGIIYKKFPYSDSRKIILSCYRVNF